MNAVVRPVRRTCRGVIVGLATIVAAACSTSSGHAATSKLTLESSDLGPGWTQKGQQQPPNDAQRRNLYACLARPLPALTSQAASALFSGPTQVSAYSVTEVFPSTAAAASDFAAQGSTSWAACASSLETQLFAVLPPGTTFGNLSVATLPFPRLGHGTVAHRLSLPVTQGGARTTATADTITVLDGPTELTVSFVGTTSPSNTLSESAVVSAILTRA